MGVVCIGLVKHIRHIKNIEDQEKIKDSWTCVEVGAWAALCTGGLWQDHAYPFKTSHKVHNSIIYIRLRLEKL